MDCYVGINYNSPDYRLHVIGDAAIGALTNYSKIGTNGDFSQHGTARRNWTKYTADSITLTAGTSADALSDLQNAFDGNFYNLSETAAAPGMNLIVDFVSVTAFNWVMVKGCYNGSSTHAVAIQLYNWTQTRWDTYHALQNHTCDVSTSDGYIIKDQSFYVVDDSEYIGTGVDDGKVRVRFYHTMSGNASHDLYIDVTALYQ
jgi:hypothetical protein